ncbi:MAG TPA: peptide deformylase [Patescibacteria group bacterium]|nr:peptide deformylase [Patescibacteria group bacterium]
MSRLQIITLPKNEETLRKESQEFDLQLLSNPDWKTFLSDFKETMYAADGVGLAAPQVGRLLRLVAVDFEGEPQIMINPKITKKSWFTDIAEEGCLSVPKIYGRVKRHKKIKVTFFDETGQPKKLTLQGIVARITQHELDHLDGVLFIDKIIK